MKGMLDILDQGDPCALFTVVLILVGVGGRLSDPIRRRWGVGLGVVAFLAYGGYAWDVLLPSTAQALLGITLRSLAAGGLATGLAWLALPPVDFLYRHAVLLPAEKCRAGAEAAARRRAERARLREQEEARRRREEEYARSAPERERAQREAEAAAPQRAEAQRRREEARIACEVLYALHAPDIGQRLTKETFDDFVKRRLGDDRTPEYVEERARQLREIIERHAEKVCPSPKESTVEETMAAYRLEVERITAAGLDPDWRDALLLKLKDQLFERLTRRTEES